MSRLLLESAIKTQLFQGLGSDFDSLKIHFIILGNGFIHYIRVTICAILLFLRILEYILCLIYYLLGSREYFIETNQVSHHTECLYIFRVP